MKTFKFFLMAICFAVPFVNVFAENDNDPKKNGSNTNGPKTDNKPVVIIVDMTKPTPGMPLPLPRRDGDGNLEVVQINSRTFEVSFYEQMEDVVIEILDEEGYLIGDFEASIVFNGDKVRVTTTSDGAIEITITSDDEVVFEAEI